MSDKYSGDIDPEIAALLQVGGPPSGPSFDDLFEGPKPTQDELGGSSSVDFNKVGFARVEQFSEQPKPWFDNPNYYKIVLADMGEIAARVHKVFTDLINAQDAETRGQNRMRFIPAWWDFLEATVRNLSPSLPEPKRLAIRFGVLLPSLLSPEQKTNLSSTIYDNQLGEPIHYTDEWLLKVGSGEVAPLATDEEVRVVKKGTVDNSLNLQRLEKLQGQSQAQSNLITIKIKEMTDLEDSIVQASAQARVHEKHATFSHLPNTLSQQQRSALATIQDALKKISLLDREITVYYRDLEKMHTELKAAQEKVKEGGGAAMDSKVVVKELGSLRQIAKMAVGRQGNHFPVVMKQYLSQRLEEIGTRENVLNIMAQVERLDPGLFHRVFKNTTNRIVPHVILIPSFGEFGLCWEPFEKFNRSTSRGRIAVPMYTKNLRTSVMTALGDLRWQVVKEKAGYRWMEEGLTGWYYQWFTDQGLRGDVKESFIQDYIIWLTKESEGTQKLDKEVRGIFWRNMPFPDEIRETLRNRGFVYNELYKKDQNRAMSDGY